MMKSPPAGGRCLIDRRDISIVFSAIVPARSLPSSHCPLVLRREPGLDAPFPVYCHHWFPPLPLKSSSHLFYPASSSCGASLILVKYTNSLAEPNETQYFPQIFYTEFITNYPHIFVAHKKRTFLHQMAISFSRKNPHWIKVLTFTQL